MYCIQIFRLWRLAVVQKKVIKGYSTDIPIQDFFFKLIEMFNLWILWYAEVNQKYLNFFIFSYSSYCLWFFEGHRNAVVAVLFLCILDHYQLNVSFAPPNPICMLPSKVSERLQKKIYIYATTFPLYEKRLYCLALIDRTSLARKLGTPGWIRAVREVISWIGGLYGHFTAASLLSYQSITIMYASALFDSSLSNVERISNKASLKTTSTECGTNKHQRFF